MSFVEELHICSAFFPPLSVRALTVSDGAPKAQSGPADKSENRRRLNMERSDYFSRREAANCEFEYVQVSSSAAGDAEKHLMRRQEALESTLARLLVKK
ncbi:hypothetical protein ACFX2I_042960 [Malus domestica]